MKKVLLVLSLLSCMAYSQFQPQLIGGKPAAKGDFPEVIYISNGSARCSATVIGPQVILTAGHCVEDEGQITPVVKIIEPVDDDHEDVAVGWAKCRQAPMYQDGSEDHDMALCKTEQVQKVKFASIAKAGPKVGELATLSGYGCVNPRKPDGSGGSGGNDGILRYGEAPVQQLPSGTFDWFVTKGKSAGCFGDSGGPSFQHLVSPKSEKHYVIGVNSQGNIVDTSYLTALWIEKSQKFFRDFSVSERVEICGINKDCP